MDQDEDRISEDNKPLKDSTVLWVLRIIFVISLLTILATVFIPQPGGNFICATLFSIAVLALLIVFSITVRLSKNKDQDEEV